MSIAIPDFSLPPMAGGFSPAALRGGAVWPCRRDSTPKPVKFAALPKKQAVKLWHQARRFERATRLPGRQDGAIGRNGLAVLHALLFDFLNFTTGRLDPSHVGIAKKANISERSVRRGLVALKLAGVVNWLRRCREEWIDGRFTLSQERNAYAVLPMTQWLGFGVVCPRDREAPKPAAGTWGDHPPLPSPIDAASALIRNGGPQADVLRELEADPTDKLAAALARLGRSFLPPRLL